MNALDRLQEGLRVLREFVDDDELRRQQINRDVILRLELAEKCEDLRSGIDLIGKGSIQRVEKNYATLPGSSSAWRSRLPKTFGGGSVFALEEPALGDSESLVAFFAESVSGSLENSEMFCGFPLSSSVKSSRFKPSIGWPFLSWAMTLSCTRRVSARNTT